MKPIHSRALAAAGLAALAGHAAPVHSQTIGEAVAGGDVSGLLNLRYEDVEQAGTARDASALTLRSTLQYASGAFHGFSATVEVEDVRVVGGLDEYSVGPSGFQVGQYPTIADPETTELNQAFLQYANGPLTLRAGRQAIIHDSHRFVGTVPWRQDWQTFDAFTADYVPRDGVKLSYGYLDGRERIFAEDADLDSSDHVLRGSVITPAGTLVGYAYLLETDGTVDNRLDTVGLRLSGARKLADIDASYLVEYASQESETGPADFDADYLMLEGGLSVNGLTGKLGYEVLGSDSGAYGFATPLATLHAFNGWADMFLNTPSVGLRDAYLSLAAPVPGIGGSLTLAFHDYRADDAPSGVDDLGSEINLQYLRPIAGNYTLGLKYADYSDGDLASLTDTSKFWLWFQARF